MDVKPNVRELKPQPLVGRLPKSRIIVSVNKMGFDELESILKLKLAEKLGKDVPVTLMEDKTHAKCGLCDSVVSINKKFEIAHLVRHYNAWHSSEHRCEGEWCLFQGLSTLVRRPLSIMDFAVIDYHPRSSTGFQCLWCGEFFGANALAAHFSRRHYEEVEVPNCGLCVQELVVNARLVEKYGQGFIVTLTDEIHLKCERINGVFENEIDLDIGVSNYLCAIDRSFSLISQRHDLVNDTREEHLPEDMIINIKEEKNTRESFSNSRSSLGSSGHRKRQFIKPALRQAPPSEDSEYVKAMSEFHWKCKLCDVDIYAAVMSSGAIRHYKKFHADQLDILRFELCESRLNRVSGECMKLLGAYEVECTLCDGKKIPLHIPFNLCRPIQHLKSKHPSKMPENQSGNEE